MRWIRDPEDSSSLDEDSREWEEHWTVLGHNPPLQEPAWIGLLSNRPQFAPGQKHYNPAIFAKVINFDADRLSTTDDAWVVVVRYRRQADEDERNPLELPAEIDLDSESEEVPIDRDADGKPLLSSAGGLIAGITEEENRWIFNVSKNLPSIPRWLLDYRNAVNIDAVRIGGLSIAPGYLLLKTPRAGKPETVKFRGRDVSFVPFSFSLVYNPRSWITRYYDRDLYELKVIETTTEEKLDLEDPANYGATSDTKTTTKKTIQRVRITAQNDQGDDVEVDEPQFLDGKGRRPRNPDGTIKHPLTPDDIVTIERWTKKRLPFRALPLT